MTMRKTNIYIRLGAGSSSSYHISFSLIFKGDHPVLAVPPSFQIKDMDNDSVSAASNLTGIISFAITMLGTIAAYRHFRPSAQLKAFKELLQEAETAHQSLCEENFLQDPRLKEEISETIREYVHLSIIHIHIHIC
jgi:hypothetical protein